jgi:hypothetical protein
MVHIIFPFSLVHFTISMKVNPKSASLVILPLTFLFDELDLYVGVSIGLDDPSPSVDCVIVPLALINGP